MQRVPDASSASRRSSMVPLAQFGCPAHPLSRRSFFSLSLSFICPARNDPNYDSDNEEAVDLREEHTIQVAAYKRAVGGGLGG